MTSAALATELREARERMLILVRDLGGAREFGPRLAIVNPPRWEVGHVGWFQEYWCLRRLDEDRFSAARGESIVPEADRLYNSATVPHATRWTLPLPEFDATLRYCEEVRRRTEDRLAARCSSDDAYFARLAVRHEDMHAEAFHYTRQTLGYEAPALEVPEHPIGDLRAGDAEIAGGPLELGEAPSAVFAFDNEKWAHPVRVRPFRLSRVAVSNAEFAAFVQADGYRRRELWCESGWRWLASADAFSDCAIASGSSQVNTPGARSRALLFCVTRWDHRCCVPDRRCGVDDRAMGWCSRELGRMVARLR